MLLISSRKCLPSWHSKSCCSQWSIYEAAEWPAQVPIFLLLQCSEKYKDFWRLVFWGHGQRQMGDRQIWAQSVVKLCFFTIMSMYIFYGGQCLQCYTLPVITFCLSLLNLIAGYFVFRWIGKWRLINCKGKAPTTPISWENKVLEAG